MKKILIWGTGKIANEILENGINGEIIGFIETNVRLEKYKEKEVYTINAIPKEYDFIIVANSFADEIYQICLKENIDLNKVIFLTKIKRVVGVLDLLEISSILGDANYTRYCQQLEVYQHSFFENDIKRYKRLNRRENFKIQESYIWPILTDKYAMAGTMGNYFWQDLWAAKLIYNSGIKKHFDIGSRIDGFIAHLLAMNIEVTLIDIREFPGEVENLYTLVDDATRLRQVQDNSIDSISALCSLEHFGLGRYGDSVNPEACFECFCAIQKKIKKGGNLYLSVPIGKERVEFNAHRVFYANTIIENFCSMKLEGFSCVAEGKIENNVEIHKYDFDEHNGDYRYGLFHFIKN